MGVKRLVSRPMDLCAPQSCRAPEHRVGMPVLRGVRAEHSLCGAPARILRAWRRVLVLRIVCLAATSAYCAFAAPGTVTGQTNVPAPWTEWRTQWSSAVPATDLVARARESARRDSIVHLLADVLQRNGLPASSADPADAAWIHARVLEALSNDDPRFLPFLKRADAPSVARAWDPSGKWTLPAVLALSEHGAPEAARAWCDGAVIDLTDAPFLHVLRVEAELAAGDTLAAGRAANEILASGALPSWAQERVHEARIAAALASHDRAAGPLLADYARRFTIGPWYLTNARRQALLSDRPARADSLGWELARQFPSSHAAKRWLEQRIPLASGAWIAARPSQLRLLATVAESHLAFDRLVKIGDGLRDHLSSAGRDSFALRIANLGYKARRYQDLLALVESGRWTPGPSQHAEWARTVARAYRNTGQIPSMETWFAVAEREGNAEIASSALLEWGRELESQREFARAETVYRRLLGRDAGSKTAALRAGLCLYRLGRMDDARPMFETALAGDAEVRSAAYFWLARCALESGEPALAESLLRELSDSGELSDTYYGFRARTALQAREEAGLVLGDVSGYWSWLASIADAPAIEAIRPLAEMNEGRPWESDNQGLSPALNEAARRLMLFRQFGRSAWATRALDALDRMPELGDGRERIATLHRLGFPDLATRRTIRNGYSDPQLRYPTPYGDAVLAACARWNLAPEWSWAIMRRESFFERTVQSGAGAIGLMQFMPATARQVAAAHGLPAEPLRAPYVNLRLGIAHLRDLVDELSGNWPAALAGYNAGIDNARRWQHPEDDLDVYIENIGYRETRDYVKAVLQGYWTYRELLRGRLGTEP